MHLCDIACYVANTQKIKLINQLKLEFYNSVIFLSHQSQNIQNYLS